MCGGLNRFIREPRSVDKQARWAFPLPLVIPAKAGIDDLFCKAST